MTGFAGFCLGFFVASLVGLIMTTTPKQAAENLRRWRDLVA